MGRARGKGLLDIKIEMEIEIEIENENRDGKDGCRMYLHTWTLVKLYSVVDQWCSAKVKDDSQMFGRPWWKW